MAFLEFRPYSAFNFGGRNRRPKAENFQFRPKISASGIPLLQTQILKGLQGTPCKSILAEYGRNFRKALDFFFPSVFQDEVLTAWFS